MLVGTVSSGTVQLDLLTCEQTVSCITSNDRPFGCPIINTDIFHNTSLFTITSNNAYYEPSHSLIGMPYLAIIASNVASESQAVIIRHIPGLCLINRIE